MIQHEATKGTKDTKNRGLVVSHEIIGAAIEVHRQLGPGLFESAYEAALCQELWLRRIGFERQVPIKIVYKGQLLAAAVRLDLVVERSVVVEIKALRSCRPFTAPSFSPTSKSVCSRPPHQLQCPSPPKRNETRARWVRSPSWPSCLRG